MISNNQGSFLRQYTDDVLASVVVFLVALPLCMGIAIASGVPPAAGLITGIIGGLIVGTLAGSPLQVSGPAAGLAVMVWEIVQKFGIQSLGVIVALAGLIQISAGLLKLGQWFRAVPPSLIQGMLAGIGVLIFASQFHVMLDHAPLGSGVKNLLGIPEAILGLGDFTSSPHAMAAWTGVVTILSILAWDRFKPRALRAFPAPLIGVVVGTAFAGALGFGIRKVDVPAQLWGSTQLIGLDGLLSSLSWPILGNAVALAFVASAETLLCATAVDQLHKGERTRYDRELAAQGIGNLLCGWLGALPMSGVIVRSSANLQAGAKTRVSAILHGALLLIFVVAVPFVLRVIPTAALAAVLVVTGYKLVNIAVLKDLKRFGRGEVLVYFATLGVIVGTDLLTGVIVGFMLSAAKTLLARSQLVIDIRRDPSTEMIEVHLSGAATFLQLPRLASVLESIPLSQAVKIHAERLEYIDHACLNLIQSRERMCEKTLVDSEKLLHLSRPAERGRSAGRAVG